MTLYDFILYSYYNNNLEVSSNPDQTRSPLNPKPKHHPLMAYTSFALRIPPAGCIQAWSWVYLVRLVSGIFLLILFGSSTPFNPASIDSLCLKQTWNNCKEQVSPLFNFHNYRQKTLASKRAATGKWSLGFCALGSPLAAASGSASKDVHRDASLKVRGL